MGVELYIEDEVNKVIQKSKCGTLCLVRGGATWQESLLVCDLRYGDRELSENV